MKVKEIIIVKGEREESYGDFRARMFSEVQNLKELEGLDSLKIVLTESAPPRLSVIPFMKEKVAAISVVRDSGKSDTLKPGQEILHTVQGMDKKSAEDFNNGQIEKENEESGIDQTGWMEKVVGFRGAYRVEEAIPVQYEPDWEAGTVTPGVCLLTLFESRPDISYDTFIDRWHNSHTPLSLKIHPLWNYNRNVVLEKLTGNSCGYQGIVEEQFRIRRDLLNPFIFFGPLQRMPVHMIQVYRDTKSFIDYKRIETFLANEYLVIR